MLPAFEPDLAAEDGVGVSKADQQKHRDQDVEKAYSGAARTKQMNNMEEGQR